jgi:ADP-ribosylglycohydrolase
VDTRDRIRGSLVGLATGDALGAAVEFLPPGTFPPVTELRGGGPHGLEAGYWTDDTSLALCLAESLVERRGFDPRDQLARYLAWYRDGHLSATGHCFDIGVTTLAALRRFEATGDPDAGLKSERSAGNGSLMRVAPVPLAYHRDPALAVELSGQSSSTTHALPVCIDACRYYGALIAGAMRDVSKEELLAPRFAPSTGCWERHPLHPEIDGVAMGSFLELEPPVIRGGGHVVRSLEAALWAFSRAATFEEGSLLAVNLGDDADTTGAVYGALAGAYHGIQGIPRGWRDGLAHLDLIERFADRLDVFGSELPSA